MNLLCIYYVDLDGGAKSTAEFLCQTDKLREDGSDGRASLSLFIICLLVSHII